MSNKHARKPDEFRSLIIDKVLPALGTLFIASCSYLLFNVQADRVKLRGEIEHYSVSTRPELTATEMQSIFERGIFATGRIADREGAMMKTLTQAVRTGAPALPAQAVSAYDAWYATDLARAHSERGQIAGYMFADSLQAQEQKVLLDVYDRELRLTSELWTLSNDWKTLPEAQRESHWNAVLNDFALTEEAFGSLKTNGRQTIGSVPELKDANAQRRDELLEEARQIEIRSNLAIAGICAGVLLIGFAIWHVTSSYQPKPPPPQKRGKRRAH